MKSILKNIAGAFVEIDSDEKPVPVPLPTAVVHQSIVVPSGHGIEYEQFKEQFKKILSDENDRNFPGNDYYEFVAMKNAMNAIPQETLRYQSAFSGWSAAGRGLTKQKLLETAQVYLGLVDKEIGNFEEAYQIQYKQQVTTNEKLIEQKSQELQQVVERMNQLNAEIQSLKQQNISNTSSLTSKHDAFMVAGKEQRDEIAGEIAKINQYIN